MPMKLAIPFTMINVVIAPLRGPRNVPESKSNATWPHSLLAAILDFCSRYFYCHRCSTLFASYSAQKIWHLTTFSFCAVLETISRLNCHGILISKASNEQGPSMFTMPNGRYPARIDGSLKVQRGRSTENESSR